MLPCYLINSYTSMLNRFKSSFYFPARQAGVLEFLQSPSASIRNNVAKTITYRYRNLLKAFQIDFLLSFLAGKYGLLSVAFEFKRRINFYLLSWYLPATLIVALSWVGFWIDTKSTPARISLGTITILAMGSFLIGEQEGFPSVSYVRAIDIYLITCFVFVFGCMVEYPFVHYAKRLAEKMQVDKKDDPEVISGFRFKEAVSN